MCPLYAMYRAQRNYVLGATTLVRPSSARPLEIVPPSERPACCASPGCAFYANRLLSAGSGLHCCRRCQDHPGKHSAQCERRRTADGPPPEWSLACHGTVDVDMHVHLRLPIPTFLIPLPLIRWLVPRLVRAFYPHLIALNEQFASTAFASRVEADSTGFYQTFLSALHRRDRPHVQQQPAGAAGEAEGHGQCARFVLPSRYTVQLKGL